MLYRELIYWRWRVLTKTRAGFDSWRKLRGLMTQEQAADWAKHHGKVLQRVESITVLGKRQKHMLTLLRERGNWSERTSWDYDGARNTILLLESLVRIGLVSKERHGERIYYRYEKKQGVVGVKVQVKKFSSSV